jgi:hypothetical protein
MELPSVTKAALPDRQALGQAFDQAVLDLNTLRNTDLLSGPWYQSDCQPE